MQDVMTSVANVTILANMESQTSSDVIEAALQHAQQAQSCAHGLYTFPGGRKIINNALACVNSLKTGRQHVQEIKGIFADFATSAKTEAVVGLTRPCVASIIAMTTAWEDCDNTITKMALSESVLTDIVEPRFKEFAGLVKTAVVNHVSLTFPNPGDVANESTYEGWGDCAKLMNCLLASKSVRAEMLIETESAGAMKFLIGLLEFAPNFVADRLPAGDEGWHTLAKEFVYVKKFSVSNNVCGPLTAFGFSAELVSKFEALCASVVGSRYATGLRSKVRETMSVAVEEWQKAVTVSQASPCGPTHDPS